LNELSIGLDSHLFADGGGGDRQVMHAARWLFDYLWLRIESSQASLATVARRKVVFI
jgi:hypothetical protein